MKIKSMTATFGKLERAHLECSDGLNLLCLPNEGGKSTWAAFWKAMLYGIDTKERDKRGALADKNHYQPWSGRPMEGEVVLEWEGRSMTIRRGPKGSVPFGAFSAVYTGTGEPVPGLTGENCGLMLTGVSREVFERSAFIGGGELPITSAPDLERRIAALISSGEEEISYTQVESRLKEWLNRRKVNRNVGLLPKLELELSKLGSTLLELEQTEKRIIQLEQEEAGLMIQRRELNQEREIHQHLEKEALNQRFAQAEEDYQKAQVHQERLERELSRFGGLPDRERLKQAQGELQYLKVLEEEMKQAKLELKKAEEACEHAHIVSESVVFAGLSGTEAKEQVQTDRMLYQRELERAERQKKRVPLLQGVGMALFLGFAALDFVLYQKIQSFFWIGLAGYLVVAVCSFLSRGKSKKTLEQAGKILRHYEVDTLEELTILMDDYVSRCQLAEEATNRVKTLRGALNERKARHENSRMDLLDFVHQFAPEVSDLFGCSAALSRMLNLEHELSRARERTEERQRRKDDLEAQGGRATTNLAYLHTPDRTPEETQQVLLEVEYQLEQTQRQLNQARGRRDALGDPAVLGAKREELERERERREQEYQALTIALETLKEANIQMQTRFSPELNRLTSTYMEWLTGERYSYVTLNRAMEGEAARPEDITSHSALYLSRGTVDQLYLALRLAVCKLCLPDQLPILLDDALVTFDDQRLELALKLLMELSKDQQILLFTCQSREGQILERMEKECMKA